MERYNLQGKREELNLPALRSNKFDDSGVSNVILAPDGKALYYQTHTSTQSLPPVQGPVTQWNVIQRYDIASGATSLVVRAAPDTYFNTGYGGFALSSDGNSLAYVQTTPSSSSDIDQTTIWRLDLAPPSTPISVTSSLNNAYRLLWCGDNLYAFGSAAHGSSWVGIPLAKGLPVPDNQLVRLKGEVLGCAP